jgi:hypothetical protein
MDRFERNFARLLATYAMQLRAEAQRKFEGYAARLVYTRRKGVASRVRLRIDPEKASVPAGWADLLARAPFLNEKRVEDFLLAQHNDIQATSPSQRQFDGSPSDDDEGVGSDHSDQESHNSENDDETRLVRNDTDIDKVKDFLFASNAFKQLLQNVDEFITPNRKLEVDDGKVPVGQPNRAEDDNCEVPVGPMKRAEVDENVCCAMHLSGGTTMLTSGQILAPCPTSYLWTIRIAASNYAKILLRPKPRKGLIRITWTCVSHSSRCQYDLASCRDT